MNNLPKVVAQQRRGRALNPRLLDHKSDALPLRHRATQHKDMSTLLKELALLRSEVRAIATLRTEMGEMKSRSCNSLLHILSICRATLIS